MKNTQRGVFKPAILLKVTLYVSGFHIFRIVQIIPNYIWTFQCDKISFATGSSFGDHKKISTLTLSQFNRIN